MTVLEAKAKQSELKSIITDINMLRNALLNLRESERNAIYRQLNVSDVTGILLEADDILQALYHKQEEALENCEINIDLL